tara:strand:+ start:279 stop:755 length:477 start_codon:yes stop_codon:yes gene_type:complete
MAIFSGKIIEAYYTNADNTCIEVLYKEGEKAICYYIEPDMLNPNFKALIEEYPMAKIAESTVQRNKNTFNKLNQIVNNQVEMRMKDKPMENFSSVVDFIINYDEKKQAEELFALKLKIFDKNSIKDHKSNEDKKKIRQAKTPLEVLLAYSEILEQQNK